MQILGLKFLLGLIIIPLLAIWSWHQRKRHLAQLQAWAAVGRRPELQKGHTFFGLKTFLLLLTMTLVILALARPRWGHEWEEVKRRGVDILVAVDVSKSMLATDVTPNRLAAAKRSIEDLINLAQGDRLGLIVFAGQAYLQCPMTLDYGAVKMLLAEIDPNMMSAQGTNLEYVIRQAMKTLAPGAKSSQALVIITDGEGHRGNAIAAAEEAAKAGIKIYTVGIGSAEGAPIPDGEGNLKKDAAGNIILSKLDEAILQKIALATGGSYIHATNAAVDLKSIYQNLSERLEQQELKSGKMKIYQERFQGPLHLALACLLIYLCLGLQKLKWRRPTKMPASLNAAPPLEDQDHVVHH